MPRSHILEYSTKKLPSWLSDVPQDLLRLMKVLGGETVLGQKSLANSGLNNI